MSILSCGEAQSSLGVGVDAATADRRITPVEEASFPAPRPEEEEVEDGREEVVPGERPWPLLLPEMVDLRLRKNFFESVSTSNHPNKEKTCCCVEEEPDILPVSTPKSVSAALTGLSESDRLMAILPITFSLFIMVGGWECIMALHSSMSWGRMSSCT